MRGLALIVANPVAGSSSERKLRTARALLEEAGYGVEVLLTSKGGDAEALARGAAARGPAFVMAAGGDGTFNEVANGLAGGGAAMALLPMGTSNVLAKELGVPEDPEGAVRAALSGRPRSVCLGRISMAGGDRYFCLMAGVGFDGLVVARALRLARRPGKLAHIAAGLLALPGWRPGPIEVVADGRAWEGRSAIVCNAAKYAGHFRIAPDARMADPTLRVVLMRGGGRLDMARYVLSALAGRLTGLGDVAYFEAREVEVRGEAHVQTDGDYRGLAPASISVAAGALKIIY
ncbi:MAG: diacylglycerol kinase family lipid kinase [Thermodesulfovibrionales bacterium]